MTPEHSPAALYVPMPSLGDDLRRFGAMLHRRRWLGAWILVGSLLLSVVISALITPNFRASGTVKIDPQTEFVTDWQGRDRPIGDWDIERELQTHIDIIQSQSLARRVMADLSLNKGDEYFAAFNIARPKRAIGGNSVESLRAEAIVTDLQSRVSATTPRRSRVIEIAFNAPDPVWAARLANAYIAAFLAENMRSKQRSRDAAIAHLERQLSLAKLRLEQSEETHIAYARSHGLVDIPVAFGDGFKDQSLAALKLARASEALSSAQAARIAAEGNYRAMAQNGAYTPLRSDRLSELKAELAAKNAEDKTRYLPGHPVFAENARKLDALDAQIALVQRGTRAETLQSYRASALNEAELSALVAQLRQANDRELEQRVQLNILARNVAAHGAMYDALLQSYRSLRAKSLTAGNSAEAVDRAISPKEAQFPRASYLLALALVGGILCALIAMTVRDYFDDAARTPEDITEKLRLPFLGGITHFDPVGDIAALLDDPADGVSEDFAALRTSLAPFAMGGANCIMITSAIRHEGASIVAYGAARSFARMGRKVMIIDANLRHPTQHELVAAPRQRGLTDCLTGDFVWHECGYDVRENLTLLPAGSASTIPSELLAGPNFANLVKEIKGQFDIILLDAPAVMEGADAAVLGKNADHIVLALRADHSTHGLTMRALRRMAQNQLKVSGVILTDMRAGWRLRAG